MLYKFLESEQVFQWARFAYRLFICAPILISQYRFRYSNGFYTLSASPTMEDRLGRSRMSDRRRYGSDRCHKPIEPMRISLHKRAFKRCSGHSIQEQNSYYSWWNIRAHGFFREWVHCNIFFVKGRASAHLWRLNKTIFGPGLANGLGHCTWSPKRFW